jgi:hypothetical protein
MFFERILWSFQGFISVPCQPSGRRGIPTGRSSVSNIRPDDEIFQSGCPSVSRIFEQFKIASVRTQWQIVRTLFRVRENPSVPAHPSGRRGYTVRSTIQCLTSIRVSASRHSYGKTAATVQTMSSIRQEHAYQVQPSGRQPSWSGRSSFIYGNCVHQFNRPDVSLKGPDAPSLIMVISCSRSVTVRTLGQHCPDVALLWKLSALSWRGGCSWPSGRSVKPSGHPRVFWS